MGFKLLRQAFQEIMDKALKQIEEIKYLGKEIYGMDMKNPQAAGEQFRVLSEKGEEEFLNWAGLFAEGMMLEAGMIDLKKRKATVELMLEMLEDTLAESEKRLKGEDR